MKLDVYLVSQSITVPIQYAFNDIRIRLRFILFKILPFVFLISIDPLTALSQACPPNIDFESGNFDGWKCYTGFVAAVGNQNVITLTQNFGPLPNRQDMLSAFPGNGLDPFGLFPMNCPNGSGHSIKLGNDEGGGQAEGISYEFTIPADRNTYSLIYHYAVVFQDPNHQENEQPRMEIEITNETDNRIIQCSSFTFIPFGTVLPGFQLSSTNSTGTPVWYKDWSAVSINLDGHAGKKIKLFFKTADCTFRRHFGYAYIDVNSECSGTFVGATYCVDDTAVNVVAPYGYQSYEWYNISFTQLLGTQQVLTFKPPPPAGTTVAVIVTPYNGYGCLDTLYAQLQDTLHIIANAGPDMVSCNHNPVQLGSVPRPGIIYTWSPATGLSDPTIANPRASPDVTTTYILRETSTGGGCLQTDTVTVTADVLDTSIQFIGTAAYCIGSGDSSILQVQPADSIQWYRDTIPLAGENQTRLRVTTTGIYFARLMSFKGCVINTAPKQITIASIPVAGFRVDAATQCMLHNNFIFTNTSTNEVGSMQYRWVFGDQTEATTRDVAHVYKKAGIYLVKLFVSSIGICADSSSITVTVNQNVIADFTFRPVCINLPLQLINNTSDTLNTPVNYLWNMGNGQTSILRTPPVQLYPAAGVYPISLSVSTALCPTPVNTIKHFVIVDEPRPALNYHTQYAVINLPLGLQARPFGENVLWSPGINLDTRNSYTPVFKGNAEQLYTIRIMTNSGCVTVDTQLVKTVEHVEVFVPNAFTPNHDGKNDLLRPVSFGIRQVNDFKVFNRWGQLLFRMQSDMPGWDGTYKGVKLEMQTIVWTFEGIGVDGNVYTRRGTTVLMR